MKRFNFVILTALAFLILSCNVFASDIPTPSGYNANDFQKMVDFLEQTDEKGVKNGFKLNPNYSPYNPSTWGEYIEWVNIAGIKRVKIINFLELSKSISVDVVGNLNLNNFSNLVRVDCMSTSISKLDLGYLPNLEYLCIEDTPISSLDLSAVPKLGWLRCKRSSISNLDLSNVPELYDLECSLTDISNLDLSNVPNLLHLDFFQTKISCLDLSIIPKLRYLACDITEIDLSKVPDLRQLTISNSDFSELDLSVIPKLETLECIGTQISSLDLSKVPNLWFLYCTDTLISNLDLSRVPKLKKLYCHSCKLSIDELKNIKLNYSHLYDKSFEYQKIFDSYIFTKGDISNFGNKTSTYKWYADDVLIDNISTPTYDLSDYKGKKIKCEITDGDITLKSNKPTVIGIEFDNPPENINKGTKIKLSAILNTFDIEIIEDTSVSWSIYNTESSSIDANGNLNVAENETSEYITVRATSNFNPEWYEEIKIFVTDEGPLKEAIEDANKINNKKNATIDEVINATIKLSGAIKDYQGN